MWARDCFVANFPWESGDGFASSPWYSQRRFQTRTPRPRSGAICPTASLPTPQTKRSRRAEASVIIFTVQAHGLKRAFLSASGTVGEWLSLVEHLVRDQGVGGSNPLSPTNFSLAFSIVYGAFCPSLFDEFRYIRYNRRQFKADAILLSPLSAEGNVLFDFVVEVAYVLSRMTHPVLVKTFGAVGIVPQVRFSEATESMVSRLVCSAVRVDVVHSGAPRSCNRIVLLLGRGPWVAGNNRAYPKGVHLTTSSGRS